MTPAEEKQFLAEAEADAVERVAQLERWRGPGFDPRQQGVDDRVHLAFLLMRDRCEALRQELESARLERDAFDASVGEHKRELAAWQARCVKQQDAIDRLAASLYVTRTSIEAIADTWFPSRARLRRLVVDVARRLEPYRDRVTMLMAERMLSAIRGLREEGTP